MKPQPMTPKPDIGQADATMRLPPELPAIDSQEAANDDLTRNEKYEKVPNPLWAINLGMAVFFVTAALVMMFS